jgi:hypothetical protein
MRSSCAGAALDPPLRIVPNKALSLSLSLSLALVQEHIGPCKKKTFLLTPYRMDLYCVVAVSVSLFDPPPPPKIALSTQKCLQ